MSAHFEIGDVNARRAIDAPADAPLLAIVGGAASGKTDVLAARYIALLARDATLSIGATIVSAAQAEGAAALAARIDAILPHTRAAERAREGRYLGRSLEHLAFDLLAEHATLSGLAYDLEAIDAYDAEEIFERAIAPLFSPDWNEFLGPDIDPEIPGLRAPDRFTIAVLRLIRKLRAAQITPEAFLKAALRGATAFYANPPNLAAPALLLATKDEHRAALAVDAAERERQRRREIDLAKIIAKLYRSYLDELVGRGCLTASDAIAEATRLLEDHPAIARTCRRRFRIALIDDVHDLHTGEFRLLQAIFGPGLAGVTVAGDPQAATATFAGARPDRIFATAATTLRLAANYRVPAQIVAVARALLEPQSPALIPIGDAVRLYRAATQDAEAAFVAENVAARIVAGTPPGRIAVLHRSLRTLALYEDALVDRNIPIALRGDAALFARHDTLDALALLWSTVDPFRHAWLLRVLALPLLALSDATLATLCGEPASPQAALFEFPAQERTDGGRRWDRRRDLRLGTNVVRGDRDADLDPLARERLAAFRVRRERWQTVARTASAAEAARMILLDAGIAGHRPGETQARTRRRRAVVDRLLAVIARYTVRHPGAELAAALTYCERIARSESGPVFADDRSDAVVVAAIERVKGRRFDHVFVVDVRAGSFPPYYVPDAFLFSPTYGMIPKDSVGEAITSRTAKFTWYAHQAKLRESYAREDRRALTVALTRADVSATVSAAGRATRGIAAPELLVELDLLRPPLITAEPARPVPRIGGETTAPTPPRAAPCGTTAGPILVAAERVAEMLRCVRCAPHGVVGSALAASFTLLCGRLANPDRRIEARDVQFGCPLGPAVVFGCVPGLIRHAGRTYVAVARQDGALAALAIHALRERVASDAYFVETADGVFSGPHSLAADEHIAQAEAVLEGSVWPVCPEHARAI